jgi:gliding motility-associated protein GldM
MGAGESANPLRQKMINMMYLVLTALLALNVSADILKAFALVNGGLEKTNADYLAKNDATMEHFSAAYKNDQKRAQQFYDNARKANEAADRLFNDLQQLKETMADEADGWVAGTNKTAVMNDQDLEISENYFVTREKGKKGRELRQKLENFQKQMRGLLIDGEGRPAPNAASFAIDIEQTKENKKEGIKKQWHEYYFSGVPVIAAITELTKFQNDVRNAQSEVTNYLYKQIGTQFEAVDELEAVARTNTPAVYAGQEFAADLFLGARSSTQEFTATVNGKSVPVQNGHAIYKVNPTGTGEQTLNVAIQYKNSRGQIETKTTQMNYQVFTGQAVISADQMNMVYRNIENPMSISVPGFSDAQTIVNWGGLPAKRVGVGKYSIKPTASTSPNCTVSVSVRMPNGTIRSMGQQSYKVRNVPMAQVYVNGKPGGQMSKGELLATTLFTVGHGPEFAFTGLNYKVLEYTLLVMPKGKTADMYPGNDNKFSGSARERFKTVRSGDAVSIVNVKVQGPAGITTLSGPTFTIR